MAGLGWINGLEQINLNDKILILLNINKDAINLQNSGGLV
jgi:hypothetical protein